VNNSQQAPAKSSSSSCAGRAGHECDCAKDSSSCICSMRTWLPRFFLFSFSAFFPLHRCGFCGGRLRKSATIPFRKRSPVPGPRVPESGFLGFWDGWARRLLPVLAFWGGGGLVIAFLGMRGRPGSREVNEEIWPCFRERVLMRGTS
jgi:hypothetical protein